MFPANFWSSNNAYFPLGYYPATPSPIGSGGSGPILAVGYGGTGSYREDGNSLNNEGGRY